MRENELRTEYCICQTIQNILLKVLLCMVTNGIVCFCFCPSKLSWKRSTCFEFKTKIYQFAFITIYCKKSQLKDSRSRLSPAMIWQCCSPIKHNVMKRVCSYFKLKYFVLICYDNTTLTYYWCARWHQNMIIYDRLAPSSDMLFWSVLTMFWTTHVRYLARRYLASCYHSWVLPMYRLALQYDNLWMLFPLIYCKKYE